MSYSDTQKLNIADMTCEDRGRLVSAFEWLIKQDKKQNPALYRKNNGKNDRYSVPSDTEG
jgi:hypothetical protein